MTAESRDRRDRWRASCGAFHQGTGPACRAGWRTARYICRSPSLPRGSPMFVAPLLLAALVQQPTILPPPTPGLPAVARDTSPFRRLELPAANLLREGSGRPGPRYWQQPVDYTINVALDTTTHTWAGDETIRYTNNSPDTLTYLWLQV